MSASPRPAPGPRTAWLPGILLVLGGCVAGSPRSGSLATRPDVVATVERYLALVEVDPSRGLVRVDREIPGMVLDLGLDERPRATAGGSG